MGQRQKGNPEGVRVPARGRWVLFLQILSLTVGLTSVLAQEPGWQLIPQQPWAPRLALPNARDVLVDLQGYRGKVVLISFWTSDCPPCREQFNALGRLRDRFILGDLVILAVHVGEPEALSVQTVAEGVQVLFVPAAKELEAWGVQDLPTSFLVDSLGRLTYVSTHGSAFDQPPSLKIIKELLESRSGQRRIEQLGDDCLPLERY